MDAMADTDTEMSKCSRFGFTQIFLAPENAAPGTFPMEIE